MSAEKRSVQTDALQTLGMVNIGSGAGRDAIHLAVEPVIAGEILRPGEHIGMKNGKAYGINGPVEPRALGIVDPFLNGVVKEGERFWLIVYPRQITSLRHVWSHPDFPEEQYDEEKALIVAKVTARLNGDEQWIREFAENIGQTYEGLMQAAEQWVETDDGDFGGEYTYDNNEGYKDHSDKFPEFWDRYEKMTGKAPKSRGSFFTCSC